MTILSVVKDMANKVGLEAPDALYTATDRDAEEIKSLIAECTTDILESHSWQVLRTIETITGDGTTEAQALPADYERMFEGTDLWSSRWTWAFNQVSDPNEWLEYQVVPYTFVNGNWMVYGDTIHVLPIMTATETLKYWYVSNQIVSPSTGANKAAFSSDDDSLRISEKLLYLGLVWKWRAKKGQAYGEDLENYETHKLYLINKDGGSKKTVTGSIWPKRGGIWAFPQTVGS